MATTQTVSLGGRLFPVVPQKHARLRHHISPSDFQTMMSRDYGHHSYRLLCILIPAMLPQNGGIAEYQWEGFHSQEDFEAYMAGDRSKYDENNDPSPTTDEIVAAFSKALDVSGAGRLGKLLTLIQSAGTVATLDRETQTLPEQPGKNGESPSMTTGTSPQTSTGNGG